MPPRLPLALRPVVPLVLAWVRRALREGAPRADPLTGYDFPRLRGYFSPATLSSTRVVVTDRLPAVPLPDLGVRTLQEFAAGDYAGITLLDTFFVVPEKADDEALFFHELVHVVQWRHLGAEGFVEAYVRGLLERGYAGCPLEVSAYRHEARFEKGVLPYDVEAAVRAELDQGRRTAGTRD